MSAQNHHHHAALHRRREFERRQAARPAADKVTTAKVVRPTRTVVKPTVTPTEPKPTVTPTPAKPTVVPTTTPPVPVPVPVPTSSLPPPPSLSTPVASVVPSTTSQAPLPSTTPTPSPSTTNRAIPSPATSSKPPVSSTSTPPPPASGGVSTGAVVGGIIGGFVVLGLIGAAVFLFLRRAKEKKERNEKAFDASKFRQSAVMLEDPVEKRPKPRPPTMIEQLAQHRPSPAPSGYPPSGSSRYPAEQARYGSPYASPSPYGPAYPGAAYGAPNAYGQYSLPSNAYPAYENHHGYPPQPQYHYGAQQYGAYPVVTTSTRQPGSSEAEQANLVLPNPFASSPSPVSETAPTHYSSNASSTSTARDLTHSASSVHNSAEDTDAPPAYEPTGKFADYKADVKSKLTPPVSNVAGSSSGATTSTSQAPMNTSDPTPYAASTDSPTLTSAAGTSARLGPGDQTLPSRPLSGTSAITTVYDANDAYGGM
ncbi:hypothetical protein D9756_002167 [Leucocoprinus leucothites]|uniref:Uncharacterized protein n=1 Tax=Leucocoprinus leucothites TaxID=201217 RepID=A0A8H5GBA4_9AGAR|nr:hypothetical protein D9756_002167 [Leucoagaricus leucothites]